MDKSVDTFEENKRFLSVSFRNWKNIFFVNSQWFTLSPFFNVEIRSVDTVTWLQHWKGARGLKCENLRWKNSCIQQNRSFLGSVSTTFCPWLWLYCIFLVLHDSYMTVPQNKLLSSSHYYCIQKNETKQKNVQHWSTVTLLYLFYLICQLLPSVDL